MNRKKLFLASSAELSEYRKEFEIFISRKNKDWVGKGVFLELVVWEDFLDAVSQTRLQDEYNKAIRGYSGDSVHRFRIKSSTHSGGLRPVIPE